MSIVSNLKRFKCCTAELTDAKLRTGHTCTVPTCIYSMLLCQLQMKVSKAWGFAQVNTAQKTSTVQLNGVSLWCMALVVPALKTVLLPARILGDSMWNWVWCCDTLHRQRLGRYPLSHRSACRQGTQNIQLKTDVLHDFWLPLLFLSFHENNVAIDHGWLAEPPAKVSPPLHRGTTYMVVGMVLIHQITPVPRDVGVVGNDGLRNGDIFCPPWGLLGDRACFSISIGREHSNSSLVSPYCCHKVPILVKVYFTFLHPLQIHLCFALICWPALAVHTNGGAGVRLLFQ